MGVNIDYIIENLLSDIARHLPDDTPYESIKKICIYCVNYSSYINILNDDEKNEVIKKIIKDF
jgi:hypothetical protein